MLLRVNKSTRVAGFCCSLYTISKTHLTAYKGSETPLVSEGPVDLLVSLAAESVLSVMMEERNRVDSEGPRQARKKEVTQARLL